MQKEVLLKVEEATIAYSTKTSRHTANYRVSFEVEKGDRFMILGHSGCGKSTLLKAIGGYIPLFSGSMLLNGKQIDGPSPDRMFVWQEQDQLFRWKTVLENVVFPQVLKGVPKDEAHENALKFLEKVNLVHALSKYPYQLSGGMKMRVAIARALAMNPQIILMDEPFAALDALLRNSLQDELIDLQKETGVTVLFVTHDIKEAVKLGTRIMILSPNHGQVRALLNGGEDNLEETINKLIKE